ncbi:MAG: NTP transferase domain-containing protein [Nitrospira sp.]|nr:NTP transferase domain-containing protein [Nitrospira sp.]
MTQSSMADCDVIILCGGLGTRLKTVVSDRPKPMADIHGRPFLSFLIDHWLRYGARRFIFCTGHMGDLIETWVRSEGEAYQALFVRDPSLLGTGGAMAQAFAVARSQRVFVVNGDSFCEVDPVRLLRFHLMKRAQGTMVLASPDNRTDAGDVVLGQDDRVLSMVEKPGCGPRGYFNAGIYVFERTVSTLFPAATAWSLEREFIPRLVPESLYGFVTASPLFDIGTPERLAAFTDSMGACRR